MSQPSSSKKPKTSKRKGGQSSKAAANRLDIWFSSETERHNYMQFHATKLVFPPKYIDVEWFAGEGFDFPELLQAQGLTKLLELKGTYYPELVKVFYTCAKAGMDGILRSKVNGVAMVIDNTVWNAVAGITFGGIRNFEQETEGYNKMITYRGMLHNPQAQIGNRLGVGHMTAEDRLLHYIITYILTPRSTNHAQITDDDLQLVYGLKSRIQINWVLIIEETMMKAKRLLSFQFPYAVMVSRFIDYFGIDVSNEVVDNTTNITNKISKKHLTKLGMMNTPDGWTMAGAQAPGGVAEEDPEADVDEEEAAPAEPRWSSFESLMIQKMDAMLALHHEHAADVHSSLEDITSRLGNIETRLSLNDLDE